MRKTPFAKGECYHIFNRGVDKRRVFENRRDFSRFFLSLDLLNDEEDGLMQLFRDFKKSNPKAQFSNFPKLSFGKRRPLIKLIAYCLNPNHYHLLVQQVADNGIERFMHKLGTSHTKYFNQKNERSGALFQGRFKSVHIESNEQLLYVSAYVNCNSEVHKIAKADNYEWCSFPEYIGRRKGGLCHKKIVLGQFRNLREYQKFAKINAKEMKSKKEAEKLMLVLE